MRVGRLNLHPLSRSLIAVSREYLWLQCNDIRQISVVIIVVQAISHNEYIRNIEPDVIDLNLARRWTIFSEQNARFDARRPLLPQDRLDQADRLPAVEHVVQQHDAPAMKR